MCHKIERYIKYAPFLIIMSQMEHLLREVLAKYPEIERCLQKGMVNRRSLARYLIKEGVAKSNQMEALIATLRRYHFKEHAEERLHLVKNMRIQVKEGITILDFEKQKELVQEVKKLIDEIDYDKGDTFKLVVGSESVKIFIDEGKKEIIESLSKRFHLKKKYKQIDELSIIFPEKAIETKGIISFLSRVLVLHDVLITEMLTASPELLLYLKSEYTVKTYDLLKRLREH